MAALTILSPELSSCLRGYGPAFRTLGEKGCDQQASRTQQDERCSMDGEFTHKFRVE